MELRDLRAFATTVEVGAITRAAERLHLVQSAVSQAVKRLERELGVVLLDRRPDGVRPTEAGALFAEHARLIVNAVAHAKRDMDAFGELARGTVRVGVLYAAVPTVLAPLLRAAGGGLPGIELEIEEGLATALADRIRLGYLDLGIFFLPVDEHGLEITRLSAIDLALVVPADHRLARRRRVAFGELGREAWVTYPAGNPGRAWLESALREAGVLPDTLVEVETLGAVKAFVEAGRGLALLPRTAAAVEEQAGQVAIVRLVDPTPQTVLASATKLGEPSPAVLAVSRLLQQTAASLR
jgi:DNA-binding transcriptional LysR family regulator